MPRGGLRASSRAVCPVHLSMGLGTGRRQSITAAAAIVDAATVSRRLPWQQRGLASGISRRSYVCAASLTPSWARAQCHGPVADGGYVPGNWRVISRERELEPWLMQSELDAGTEGRPCCR
ncbi:hypothetical protein VFPBJ_01143 [Purpureocillium lilacinum]|uniref:Uncharacterized protein n=1 Tax=Purpureocillium lilacinum TaxID=33203 RepID=A0A179HCA6_PURLI|nr:hypothetical protein VFPBJ_01143 [Purpureocillium lilacinum]